jgi:general secretion pathway protein C
MKFGFQKWGERIRSWLGTLGAKRPIGIAAIPGAMTSVRAGTLKFPLIDWEKLYRKSFVYNSVVAVICGYFVADLLVASLTPWFPPTEAPRPRLNLPSDRRDFLAYSAAILPLGKPNLFNEKGLVPDNDEGGGGIDGPPVKTSLPLTLLGVIVIEDTKKSVASIEDKGSNLVLAVREGEPISREALTEKITEDRVIFINTTLNRREYIDLPRDEILASRKAAPTKPAAGGITKVGENHLQLDRKVIDDTMKDMSTVLQDARCVPEFKGGRQAGFRCFQITPGSIYDKLGLKENDVVCGFNGEPMTDPAKIFATLNTLKDPSTRGMQICIERNGVQANYQFDIN